MEKPPSSVTIQGLLKVAAGMTALTGSAPAPAASWKKTRPALQLDSGVPWIVSVVLPETEDRPVSAIRKGDKMRENNKSDQLIESHPGIWDGFFFGYF
jgi:hypothetical protein